MLEQRRRAKRSAVAQVGKLSKRTGTRQGRDELKHGARQAAQCLRRRGLQAFDERELDWTWRLFAAWESRLDSQAGFDSLEPWGALNLEPGLGSESWPVHREASSWNWVLWDRNVMRASTAAIQIWRRPLGSMKPK